MYLVAEGRKGRCLHQDLLVISKDELFYKLSFWDKGKSLPAQNKSVSCICEQLQSD